MSRLGFKSLAVYHGETFLGELRAVPISKDANSSFTFPNNEIRISHISPPSERSPPLSVLQTISSYSVRCKLNSPLPPEQQTNLLTLHATCFHERKTAVVVLGNEEIHLVAMPSKEKKFPCFWCCSVAAGLYNSCLGMLNLRCLAIVFDLDETLIVANTLKTFEDRMEYLKGWIAREVDPVRVSGMSAELRRVADDRALLKQYAEYDCVTDGGKVYKVQMEEIQNHEKGARPIIRLPEKNVVLTRINPEIRDTSVLVRLRPAWEDLRSYLTAKGRKRFEVYVCTMAERDYALEMWRLLDPEANLISSKKLLGRVVCVKSGSKKSLLNVFQDGICHPNLAMVIDDRMNVWEDKDQPRVHVVPAFAPYYAPQAETANAVPVLCVARNVACNIRGGFFKEFDENIHKRICDLFYEDEISSLPPAPDVSNFLMLEDTGFAPNGNVTIPVPEGMYGAEIEQRLHYQDKKVAVDSASNSGVNISTKPEIVHLPPVSASNAAPPYSRAPMPILKPSLLGAPGKRDGFSSESDLDKRRRLMTMHHGADIRAPISGDPPILASPAQISSVPSHSQGGWLVEEVPNKGYLNSQASQVPQDSNMLKAEKQRVYPNTVGPNLMSSGQVCDVPRRRTEVGIRHERPKPNLPANQIPVVGKSEIDLSNKEFQADASKLNTLNSSLSISVLQEIGRRCNAKVEFRPVLSTKRDLQFSIEVLFTGEKIGVGMGKTKKDAQQLAADNALRSLADKYVEYVGYSSGTDEKNFDMHSIRKENGFIWDNVNMNPGNLPTDEKLPKESKSEATELAIESSSSVVNQQGMDHSSSPRFQRLNSSKHLKDDMQGGSQSILSTLHQKNGLS
ncbi:hypothetical protein V2J09_010532 [Rumex salicifolius]